MLFPGKMGPKSVKVIASRHKCQKWHLQPYTLQDSASDRSLIQPHINSESTLTVNNPLWVSSLSARVSDFSQRYLDSLQRQINFKSFEGWSHISFRAARSFRLQVWIQSFAKVESDARKNLFIKKRAEGMKEKNWRNSRALSWIWGKCQCDSGTNAGNFQHYSGISCNQNLPSHWFNNIYFLR